MNSNKGMVAIEETVNWWKAIVESMNDGVLVIDRSGIVRTINPEYTRITGVTPDIIGKPLVLYRPGARLPETLASGKSQVGVYRKTHDREYVVDMAPVMLDDKIVGAVSVCKSLTEVQLLTQELEKQRQKVKELQEQMSALHRVRYTFDDIIGAESKMQDIISIARKTAATDLPVLIRGESGTGKELFAQAIHHASLRSEKPFIAVNCSAIPSALIENELFGHLDGSLVSQSVAGKAGLFEMADGGTLFLDEIGDLSLDVQAKLLRVLQEGAVRRVGEVEERRVDVRIVASTHRDLYQLIAKGLFRNDFLYRLNTIDLQIPPLRERKKEIPLITSSLLADRFEVEDNVMMFLTQYDWPGNIRELRNVLDYAMCLVDENERISIRHFPDFMQKQHTLYNEEKGILPLHEAVEVAEKQILVSALQSCEPTVGERQEIANMLGISLATLYNKMKKYNIK
ncbi:sigma-54 interaction domain-containing protein [Sporosarcina highlanderae]|uniref:Sigma 54-interacting transcriptional regulator n=1 Tax=Sporosarcina highlanderae TaxID=3035916 RepID=A0ABT8JSD4_9BACL|nr:sigma 54-interacting transcriptional regulator [Sporosarcina highlanderae]MDN4608079.1 sigma 54-interacting transcriptional regulator [Sporosarcina highlanderae]